MLAAAFRDGEERIEMRKVAVLLGLLLLAGAAGMFGYRWLYEPARSARLQQHAPWSQRGLSELRSGPRERDGGWRQSSRGQALSGVQLFELVIDLLNVVVGAVGIWLAIIGMRMQRAAGVVAQRVPARSD
jgi:hypothetical protein